MVNPDNITIIPALPGYFTVMKDGDDAWVSDAVIAWRIVTYMELGRTDLAPMSTCTPLTADGDAGGNCIGVQAPDMKVTVFDDSVYKDIASLQAHLRGEE